MTAIRISFFQNWKKSSKNVDKIQIKMTNVLNNIHRRLSRCALERDLNGSGKKTLMFKEITLNEIINRTAS